jgi:hypothetical protein
MLLIWLRGVGAALKVGGGAYLASSKGHIDGVRGHAPQILN